MAICPAYVLSHPDCQSATAPRPRLASIIVHSRFSPFRSLESPSPPLRLPRPLHEAYPFPNQNPKIKNLLALEKPRERRKQCLFVIEGKKEIQMAQEAGYKIGNLFFCEELISMRELNSLTTPDMLLIPVSRDVFDKIAMRENSGGVLAVAEQKTHRLDQIKLSANPLLLILESVEKPGNLGAILRTADAAGIDAVIDGAWNFRADLFPDLGNKWCKPPVESNHQPDR